MRPDAEDDLRCPFARAGDGLHLVFGSFLFAVALAAFAGGKERSGTAVVFFGGTLVAVAILVRAAGRSESSGSRPLRALHLVYPLLLVPAVFAGLKFLVPALPVRRFDAELRNLDLQWFGVEVARWSERILTPGLADFMMAFYFLYFFMPLALFLSLLRDRDRRGIYRAGFTLGLGLYACYLGYLLVPAYGPRPAYVGLSQDLPPGFLTKTIHDFIFGLEPQPYDAFPSAHVVMGLLCPVLAWKRGGWLRWSMVVTGALTAVSTVFLRYHYLVDDVAGLLILAGVLGSASLLERRAARKAGPRDAHPERIAEFLGRA